MSTGNIGKIKASRVNNVPNVDAYLGEKGILFYNYANGVIRMSDGITPGGVPIPYNIASNTTIGGIKAGPGTVISNDGVLFIDTANLALSFGNFTANNNVLSITNVDQNMILSTQGNAEVQLIGNIGFYKPDGLPPSATNRYATFTDSGIVQIYVTNTDSTGAVSIVGGPTKNIITPGITGAMLHITGVENIPARTYFDGDGSYVSLVARRWNGNVASPTQVLAGDDVLRINATAATNLNGGNVGNVAMAQIRTTALENQTSTAQGSSITFTVTPIGSPASARVDVANVTVASGITATKFTTSGNVNAGNVIATNYVGKVTHSIRDAGVASGTLTLNVTTDDLVKCTFTGDFTVDFSNIIPGRVITLIATNTSAGDSDIITAGISALNTTSGATYTVTQQTTAVITYYSLDSNVGSIYASAVYA